MYEELVKRLREAPSDWPDAELHYEAADAIEELIHGTENDLQCAARIVAGRDWVPLPQPPKEEM